MSRPTLADLQTAAAWLDDYGVRYGGESEQQACRQVADWLRFVAEQQEEYAARSPAPPSPYAPSPLRLGALNRRPDESREDRRVARFRSSMQAIWRARSV